MAETQENIQRRGCWCPELKGKTAIITGAGGYKGIGKEIALELARQGVNLVLIDLPRGPEHGTEEERRIGWRGIASLAELVEAAGARAHTLDGDITDPDAVGAMVAEAIAQFGGIDFLINNAGAPVGADRAFVVDLPLAEWNKVVAVNLNGTFLMSQTVGREMIRRGQGGAIVNISSIASRQALLKTAAYTATKMAINGLSRVMALEMAPHKIRVNAVLPGLTLTARLGNMPEGEGWAGFVKNYVPLGFAAHANEIGCMVTYLCSDMGKFITGQDIAVDGGSTWH